MSTDLEQTEQPVPDLPTSLGGLTCFMDGARECGPDCMAYTLMAEQSPLGLQQRHCTLLVSVERLARHVAIAAKLMNDAQIADKDRRRTDQKPPTPPR